MSTSEPRLPDGDGPPVVRTIPVARPLDAPPVTESAANGGPGGEPPVSLPTAEDAPPPSEPADRDDLPALATPYDLIGDAPPWLLSAAIHTFVLIVLGLLLVVEDRPQRLDLQFNYTDASGPDVSDEFDLPLDVPDQPLEAMTIAPQALADLNDAAMTTLPQTATLPMPDAIEPSTAPIQMALSGREKGMQRSLLQAYGGTAGTQAAVLEGLRWLARNQSDKTGLWDLNGRYADGASSSNPDAATAMALIAFQGAGYTPKSDPRDSFSTVVARGWNAFLDRQNENGSFFHDGRSNGRLYTQALATIAICELYGMTRDSIYREPAQRAIDYCVSIQSSEGGWRYFPGTGSDLSVTGWFVMALQSARMAGLEVPSPTLERVRQYLDSVASRNGTRYSYQTNVGATLSMTAEGLLCRQYLGWPHSDWRLRGGADLLVDNLPSWEDRNIYYWYYASQVCHHMEGFHWRQWNETMRNVLPDNQVKEGRERGSWDPAGDRWGSAGGRLFVTCLSIYCLEVYYRHLPIYQLELLSGS